MKDRSITLTQPLPNHATVDAESPLFDDEQVWLWEAYSLSGGLVTLHQLLEEVGSGRMAHRASSLGACFRRNGMVAFAIDSEVWVPRFQLTRDYRIFDAVTRALSELQPVRSATGCAMWFCSSNRWLQDEAPMDLVQLAPDAVVAAARAEAMDSAVH